LKQSVSTKKRKGGGKRKRRRKKIALRGCRRSGPEPRDIVFGRAVTDRRKRKGYRRGFRVDIGCWEGRGDSGRQA